MTMILVGRFSSVLMLAVLTTTTTRLDYCHGFSLLPTNGPLSLSSPSLQNDATKGRQNPLLNSKSSDDDVDDDDDVLFGMEDYEIARKAFERSISLPRDEKKEKDDDDDHVLTASLERIKEMEIDMLLCLKDSDSVIDPIVDLWKKERPHAKASKELIAMESYCSPGLVKEEALLRKMIEEYSLVSDESDDDEASSSMISSWVEPQSRLAVLLFTKGRYEEAAYWCQHVLHYKPWHFEIGRLLVVIYLRMGFFDMSLRVARHYTLPYLNPNTQNKRRKEWVEAAASMAKEQLQKARKDAILAVSNNPLDECSLDDPESVCWE